MSIPKTLLGSIAGGLALGFGLKLGETVLREKNPPAPPLISEPLETVITAVAQLAEHSGRLGNRITALEQRADKSELIAALESRLTERLAAIESVVGRHGDSIASLEVRTSTTEGCWQDLVSRMELICRELANQVAPPGITVMRPRNTPKLKQTV